MISVNEELEGNQYKICLFDDPIIIANHLILKCCIRNGSYIPTSVISKEVLLQKFGEREEKERKVTIIFSKNRSSHWGRLCKISLKNVANSHESPFDEVFF